MKKYESEEKYHKELRLKKQKERQIEFLLKAHIKRAKQMLILKKISKICLF